MSEASRLAVPIARCKPLLLRAVFRRAGSAVIWATEASPSPKQALAPAAWYVHGGVPGSLVGVVEP